MNFLVLGASGATGRLLAEALLERGHGVRAVVRASSALPGMLADRERLSVTRGNVLEMGEEELAELVRGCDGVGCCLGHTMTFRGVFGPPRRLVTDAVRRVCGAVQANAPEHPVRFVLMNTVGNRNRDLDEPVSFKHACVIGLLRYLVPPHADNECAAEYLRSEIGQSDPHIEWAAVRPDSLLDGDSVTPYTTHASPTRSAIFNPGKTSRINVADFMAELLTEDAAWERWRGQMPVIYNAENSEI